jgi:nucleoid-associated protein YgaU
MNCAKVAKSLDIGCDPSLYGGLDMSNDTRREIEKKLETATTDEVSGKLDGLDQAMDTETLEQETGGEVDSGGQTYLVIPGDSLRSIAERFYGDAEDYERIIEANRDELRDSDIVRPGLQLTIPPRAA